MKKIIIALMGILIIGGVATAVAMSSKGGNSWNYKITVTVDTPEGPVSGSAVREMGNSPKSSIISEAGNPAKVRGEAVVVDMGKRGVLFALVDDKSDNRFYRVFPAPNGGGATAEGIAHYSQLPAGTKGVLDPTNPFGYPKLVTFTDMNDAKSVTLAQIWEHQPDGRNALKQDRMAELFGQGVKLRDITMEITDEPVTWGIVDQYVGDDFWSSYHSWMKSMNIIERAKHIPVDVFRGFSQGETK